LRPFFAPDGWMNHGPISFPLAEGDGGFFFPLLKRRVFPTEPLLLLLDGKGSGPGTERNRRILPRENTAVFLFISCGHSLLSAADLGKALGFKRRRPLFFLLKMRAFLLPGGSLFFQPPFACIRTNYYEAKSVLPISRPAAWASPHGPASMPSFSNLKRRIFLFFFFPADSPFSFF